MHGRHRSEVRPTHGPLHVLRLCSAFEAPATAVPGGAVGFDPIGGMQSHTGGLTRALDRRGVVQTVVTARPPAAPWRERVGERARVYRLGLAIPYARQLYGLPAAGLAPALARRADLVHAHLGEDLAVLPIALLAARSNRLPLVVTVHCSLRHTFGGRGLRERLLRTVGGALEAMGVRAADAVIVLAARLARILEGEGLDPAWIREIPSGVEPALFAGPFDDPCNGIGHPRVLFVGRLVAQKGVDTLVDAAARLRTPGVEVLILGDGRERRRLEARARTAGVADRVRFAGFVPHHRVPAVLAHADLLVLPSIHEELGSVLIEAMQAGVPVVATRTGGIPDVVIDGCNGLLVAPGDAAALAAAVDRVLGDPALAARFRADARRRARAYDWNRLAGRVLDLYLEVIAARPRPLS